MSKRSLREHRIVYDSPSTQATNDTQLRLPEERSIAVQSERRAQTGHSSAKRRRLTASAPHVNANHEPREVFVDAYSPPRAVNREVSPPQNGGTELDVLFDAAAASPADTMASNRVPTPRSALSTRSLSEYDFLGGTSRSESPRISSPTGSEYMDLSRPNALGIFASAAVGAFPIAMSPPPAEGTQGAASLASPTALQDSPARNLPAASVESPKSLISTRTAASILRGFADGISASELSPVPLELAGRHRRKPEHTRRATR